MFALFRSPAGQQISKLFPTWWEVLADAHAKGLVKMASGKNFILAPWYEIKSVDEQSATGEGH